MGWFNLMVKKSGLSWEKILLPGGNYKNYILSRSI